MHKFRMTLNVIFTCFLLGQGKMHFCVIKIVGCSAEISVEFSDSAAGVSASASPPYPTVLVVVVVNSVSGSTTDVVHISHVVASLVWPMHSRPPCSAFLATNRLRSLVPAPGPGPQVTLQEHHSPHSEKRQWTGQGGCKRIYAALLRAANTLHDASKIIATVDTPEIVYRATSYRVKSLIW